MIIPSATEPAQDESLAYAIGVQTYTGGFPMMDLYRTLWETSFDPERGHDRTLNEFFVFDRLVTSADDWAVTANEDVIYLRAFLDLLDRVLARSHLMAPDAVESVMKEEGQQRLRALGGQALLDRGFCRSRTHMQGTLTPGFCR